MPISATRFHDFSAGHRVYGHESKCRHFHGHNYRVHFTVKGGFQAEGAVELDSLGRVLDFGVIKSILCQWVEDNWDHRFMVWKEDPVSAALLQLNSDGVILVPFNPTAENMAEYLLRRDWSLPEGLKLVKVVVEETRKCLAEAYL